MRLPSRTLVALSAVGALALAGCGEDDGGAGGAAAPADSPSATATASASTSDDPDDASDDDGDDQNDDRVVEVEIEIEHGSTTPAGKRITVKPGQTIRLEVDSEMADELHLHATPEQSFEVKAADDQEFEFSLDTPGVYELESHHTGNQVISIQVQP